MHRAERFDPTPYQVERTAVFTDVKHEANLTFPLKDFQQIIVTQFKDPKLIIDVRTGQFADGTSKSTVFVVFHHAEHARAAIQRGYAFFRGRQVTIRAYQRSQNSPRQRHINFLNGNRVRVVGVVDKTHLLVKAFPDDFQKKLNAASESKKRTPYGKR